MHLWCSAAARKSVGVCMHREESRESDSVILPDSGKSRQSPTFYVHYPGGLAWPSLSPVSVEHRIRLQTFCVICMHTRRPVSLNLDHQIYGKE